MLKSLSVQNYALIDSLDIEFDAGLSIITGETGAGKSILLGALSLLAGQRADSSVVADPGKKCVVEGVFDIASYDLKSLFDENDIDHESLTIIRREVSSDGKSRAFVNDSPVNLGFLKVLCSGLIDIHSQHDNLYMGNPGFQLRAIDSFARDQDLLDTYTQEFTQYKQWVSERSGLIEKTGKEKAELDYLLFQHEQLVEAKLTAQEQESLEEEQRALSHAEEIQHGLSRGIGLLSGDEGLAILPGLKELTGMFAKMEPFYTSAQSFGQRIETAYVDLKDLVGEIERQIDRVESNPVRLEEVNKRLDLIISLQQKHRVQSVLELIHLRDELASRIEAFSLDESRLSELNRIIREQEGKLEILAGKLRVCRERVVPGLEERITSMIYRLAMPNAIFKVELSSLDNFTPTGKDAVRFLFTANKQGSLQEIGKVASGGELSRLMLSIKATIAESVALPTIIFDEIDTGVSGDVADKMGNILSGMAGFMQVVNITHLPQVASKGSSHFLVYKENQHHRAVTRVRKLNNDERVLEIARMLSGEQLTPAAISNAKELLGA